MKIPSIGAITAAATLLLAQGCSLPVQSRDTSAGATNPQSEHSMSGMKMPETTETAQVKITHPQAITSSTPVLLVINVQGSDGKAISSFDRFQEKLMHLIVVSDDLQVFSHIHPVYKQNGRFEVEARFPRSGNYTLFSDYEPAGQTEQVSVLTIQVPGKILPASGPNTSLTKTFGDTVVSLAGNQSQKAGEEVALTFNLRQVANNQAITDLKPYLGERGHLVILRQSAPLTRIDYIHAHAAKDSPSSQVIFMTRFPQAGRYKLWGQFNRGGKVVVADFWVNVL